MSDEARRPSRQDRNEVRGAAGVASEAVDIVSRPVQGTHEAIAGTVFGALRRVGLGAASKPVQVVHDGISAGVYAAVRGIGHLAGRGVGAAAALADHPERDLTHLVLFVHGLGETEHAWRLYGEASAGEGYAERVSSAIGATP